MPASRYLRASGGRIGWGLLVGTLIMVVLSAAPVGASPVSAAANAPQTWSSSGTQWYNNSSTSSFGQMNATYSVQLFYGYSSAITATNTSNTTTQMQGQRWVNASLVATVCAPNCTSPMYSYALRVSASEWQSQFLNLTTTATVYENGTAASALGISNASAWGLSVLNDSQSAQRGNQSYSSSVLERQFSYYSVQFATPLGLIPWNLSKGTSWNDSAAFSAVGGWNDSFAASGSGYGGWSSRNGSFAGAVARNGTESAGGRDFGTRGNNSTTIRIGLRFRGPFNFDNGLFMTAIGSDLFQGATANWTTSRASSYWYAGPALSGTYSERAPAASAGGGSAGSTSGTSSTGSTGTTSNGAPTGSSGSTGGSPTGTGTNGGTIPITPTPVSTPVSTPTTTRPTGGAPSHSMLGLSSFELLGLVAGVAAVGGFVALSALRGRTPPRGSA